MELTGCGEDVLAQRQPLPEIVLGERLQHADERVVDVRHETGVCLDIQHGEEQAGQTGRLRHARAAVGAFTGQGEGMFAHLPRFALGQLTQTRRGGPAQHQMRTRQHLLQRSNNFRENDRWMAKMKRSNLRKDWERGWSD